MKSDPLLATITGPFHGRSKCRMNVRGGLHKLGNQKPYFSLTADIMSGGHYVGGGAMHEEILKHFPRFKMLAELHLSDIDGAPMHAEANGWYALAGALGGFGEEYHVGNSKRNFPIDPPADKPWKNTEYRKPTQEECVQIFADSIRVSVERARQIMAEVDPLGWRNSLAWMRPSQNPGYLQNCRERWQAICEALRPQWKAEADACIRKYNLRVFGDTYATIEG